MRTFLSAKASGTSNRVCSLSMTCLDQQDSFASQMDKYNFFQNVYEVAKLIPRGQVTSYGAIAAYLGTKSSARMVGWAMNGAGTDPKVPAHRVVNHKGLLTGKHHFETPTRMQELLEAEGVEVRNDQVVDFQDRFWDPMKKLL